VADGGPMTVRELMDAQAGVVHRRQLLELGLDDNDVRRLVRRRELARLHSGVYLNHTGPPTWLSRAWAATLYYGEAALCHRSALDLAGDPIHVAIEHPRNGAPLPGVVLHRLTRLHDRVQWHRSPPRLRLEEAALDVAGDAETLTKAIDVVTEVCNRRVTTPQRLLEALAARQRTPRGLELRRVLGEVADGMSSVLESGVVRRVLRPHGLPVGRRQVRGQTPQGVVYRDMLLDEYAVVLELDGHTWHADPASRAHDMVRDLQAAGEGLLTVRLGWPHVHQSACMTAAGLVAVLQRRGWRGRPRACSSACAVLTMPAIHPGGATGLIAGA
jgi:very-short-patch-repair endonuclease